MTGTPSATRTGYQFVIQVVKIAWKQGLFVLKMEWDFGGLMFSTIKLQDFKYILGNGDQQYFPIDKSSLQENKPFDFITDMFSDDNDDYPTLDVVGSLDAGVDLENVKSVFDRYSYDVSLTDEDITPFNPVFRLSNGLYVITTEYEHDAVWEKFKAFAGVRR